MKWGILSELLSRIGMMNNREEKKCETRKEASKNSKICMYVYYTLYGLVDLSKREMCGHGGLKEYPNLWLILILRKMA